MLTSEIKKVLLEKEVGDELLSAISDMYRNNLREETVTVLLELQNESNLNLIELFSKAKNNGKHDFWDLFYIFESILPSINQPVKEVIPCVAYWINELGNDYAVGGLYIAFKKFCEEKPNRSSDSLNYILNSEELDSYSCLISDAIFVASNENLERAIQQIKTLAEHDNANIRHQAYSAAAQIKTTEAVQSNQLWNILCESVKNETNNIAKTGLTRAIVLYGNNYSNTWDKVLHLLDDFFVRTSVEPEQIFEISRLLAIHVTELPEKVRLLLINQLKEVSPEHLRIINNIDLVLKKLIENNFYHSVESLLESLLVKPKIRITLFNSFLYWLMTNDKTLSELVTKWLLSRDVFLHRATSDIFHKISINKKDFQIIADVSILDSDSKLEFVSRKIIGWLFFYPILAGSFILSLHKSGSKTAQIKLENLLFEFLLVGYPLTFGDYLKSQTVNPEYQAISEKLLKRLEDYDSALKESTGVKELKVNQEEIEKFWSKSNEIIEKAKNANEDSSILRQLCTTQNLLYGRGVIQWIVDGSGEKRRLENELQSISVSSEIPRLLRVNPVWLEYILRELRYEGIEDEANS